MVPTQPEQIAAAIDAALARFATQVRSDARSCGSDHREGETLLTRMADSADEVRERLARPRAGAGSQTSENREGADADE